MKESKNLFLKITRDVIFGCSGGHVKCMAMKGEITTTSFKIPAKRELYHIFLFRGHWLILKFSTCMFAIVRSLNTKCSRI